MMPLRAIRSIERSPGKVKVLVVDDSIVIRHLILHALEGLPDIEVVGAVGDGLAALEAIPQLEPQVVTLDIEMPRMDGIATLKEIRKRHPRLRTIMFSTLTTRGATATFEALTLGADDYVSKASNVGSLNRSLELLRSELVPKIRQFFDRTEHFAEPPKRVAPQPAARRQVHRYSVVAVGVSTGGPMALEQLIPSLPVLPVSILIVQHMPPTFTAQLADHLTRKSRMPVLEAAPDMDIRPGHIYIAPGNYHLRARRSGIRVTAALDQEAPENSCRPAVDVLFRSVAQAYGSEVLAVVLTGMGQDGLAGTRVLKAAGAFSLVQDRPTSVVWGMPGAVADAGLADLILPLPQIANEIVKLTAPGNRPT
jgi:two-component system chemotaxis response regulator CheB